MNKSFRNSLLQIGLPIYILLLGILLYTSLTELESLKNRDDIIRENQLRENETLLKLTIGNMISDLNYLAELPGIRNFYTLSQATPDNISEQLLAFAANKKEYMQIRLIDSIGWERVRINSGLSKTEICAKAELQLKNKRYYFQELKRIHEELIYISPLDLNIEHGEIEEPIVPVLRVGKKIKSGKEGGYVYLILNYSGNTFLTQLQASQNELHQLFLINSQGYYLKGPSPEDEWRFMYSDSTKGLFSGQFEKEWAEMQTQKNHGEIKSRKGYFSYQKIRPSDYLTQAAEADYSIAENQAVEEWVFISHADKNAIKKTIYHPIYRKYLIFALLGAIILLAFNGLYVKLRASQISEGKRTRKHFSFMQSLIETIPNPIFFIDYQNDEFGCNDAFVLLMGKPKAELKKLGIEKLFHAGEQVKNTEQEQKRDVKVSELKLKYPDGSIHNLHYNKTHIVVDKEKIGFVGVYTDVTSIRKAEQALRESELNLKAANRTKNRFFSLIAHDLKNPFHSIMGLSHLLSSNYEMLPESDKMHLAQNIYRSSEKTYQLLINLLDWARLQEGKINTKPVAINIANLVRDNLTLHHTAIEEKKLKTSFDINPDLQAFADENMIRTVFRNLLSNAIKFTGDKGEIKVSAVKNGHTIEVCIHDTGIGIPARELQNLFDIDRAGHASSTSGNKGTGFGLVLCKDFIELNKGKIWVESEEGKGSRFCFTVPVAG